MPEKKSMLNNDVNSPGVSDVAHRRPVGLLVALVAGAAVWWLIPADGLTPEARRLAALFVGILILWVTEALPIGVTALLAVAAQPVLQVTPMNVAGTRFMSPVFFFVFAMFLIAAAVHNSGLDRRFAAWLLRRAGTDSRRVILAFMIGSATLSTIVSDIPACAIWAALGLTLLQRDGLEPGKSNFGRALMLAIPIAAFIGGIGTPAGSSVNLLGLQLLQEFGDVQIGFLHWMIIGIPMVIVLTPFAWWVLMRVYPPEITSISPPPTESAGPLTPPERKTLGLLGTMLALWIASTWWPGPLNPTMIAVLGSVAMFLPGMHVLEWKPAMRSVSWEALFMIGGITSLGVACSETGLAEWFVTNSLGGVSTWHPIAIIAAISAVTVAIHLVVPILPVVTALLVPPVVVLAQQAGLPPALLALPVIFTASCGFLLPLDAVSLITYGKGYYRMTDMLRPGILISIGWVIVITLLIYYVGPLVGLR